MTAILPTCTDASFVTRYSLDPQSSASAIHHPKVPQLDAVIGRKVRPEKREAAGHVTFTIRKQRAENAGGAQLALSSWNYTTQS